MSLAWELAAWDATETRARLERGEVSAREVLDAAIARATERRELNALVTPTFERARGLAPKGPLAGVPTAIKDLSRLAGVRIAWGTAASGEYVAKKSDPTVVAIEATGLVSIGKSATPELGLTATTEPLAFGPTRNPWAPGHTPGGSSGGSASLVAAGVVPLAHGSDGGGSIRIPAACCGLVGLKPSRHRLDMEGSNLLPINVAVNGVLTRSVRDTVAFWNAVEAALPKRRLEPIGAVAERPARRLKIGFFTDSPVGTPVDGEVRAATERAAKACAELGHAVEPIPCPFDPSVIHDYLRMWAFIAFAQSKNGKVLMHRGFDASKLEPLTQGFARSFSQNLGASFAAIWRLRGFGATWARTFERFDVLVSPTLATPAPPLGWLRTDVPFETARERLVAFTPFTAVANIAGAPALSLPLGRSASGLPIGVQLLGARNADRLLLELARELEAAQPWPQLAR